MQHTQAAWNAMWVLTIHRTSPDSGMQTCETCTHQFFKWSPARHVGKRISKVFPFWLWRWRMGRVVCPRPRPENVGREIAEAFLSFASMASFCHWTCRIGQSAPSLVPEEPHSESTSLSLSLQYNGFAVFLLHNSCCKAVQRLSAWRRKVRKSASFCGAALGNFCWTVEHWHFHPLVWNTFVRFLYCPGNFPPGKSIETKVCEVNVPCAFLAYFYRIFGGIESSWMNIY